MSKVIIVTGASRGLGLAIARYLLKQQHKLVITARSEQPLRELEKRYSNQVAVLAGDLADLSLGRKAVDLAKQTWKRLDGIVVNHGVLAPVTRIADARAEDWQRAYNINLFSAVSLVQAAIPSLRESKGRIVLVSSGAAQSAYATWGCYGSSKAALNHLAQTLSEEEKDIVTIALRPGVVDTDMQAEIREKHNTVMDKQHVKKFAELKTSGSLLKPEQPGHVIARLVLGAPSRLSGEFVQWDDENLKDFQEG